jgi:hypothetical protein
VHRPIGFLVQFFGDLTVNEGSTSSHEARFELWFQSLFNVGRALAFPCDREGRINFDAWGERLKQSYLFATAMTGREFAAPILKLSHRA